ncbi:MAG: hypothetical protein U0Q22_03065 [Acidimicrobiales bacterium]
MFATEPTSPQQAPGIIDATLRYRQVTIALTLIGLVLGAAYTVFQPDSYTAVGHLVLTDPRGSATFRDGSSVVDFTRYVAERTDFAMSGEVLSGVVKEFPSSGSVADIRDNCTVAGADGASVLDITCSYSEAKAATGTVDALVKVYRAQTKQQAEAKANAALAALTTETDALQKTLDEQRSAAAGNSDTYNLAIAQSAAARLNELAKRGTDIRTTQALFGDGTESYDFARIPPSTSKKVLLVRNSLIGAILGFLIAVLTAWFRADRTPIGESANDVAGWVGLPMLGEIEHRLLQSNSIDMTGTPEPSFQRVTSNLDAVLNGETVLFTPAEPIARHEDVVIKTALVAARAGKRVLLIDADQTGRSVSNILGLPSGTGLAEFIAGEAPADEATVRLGFGKAAGLGASSLYLMGPGGDPGQPPALFRSAETTEALAELRRSYDLILIDGPPLLVSAGSAVLGQAVDGVVVLIERGTPKHTIDDARRQLAFLASDALGFVFIHGA